ncbi:Compactin diketide synthase [Apiospora aurea]|uniref:Compactin diketide synthase n=1 Tax=Apiospora aurea TaxID=335848 RepID=A0ABR1QNQ9_9PEZI
MSAPTNGRNGTHRDSVPNGDGGTTGKDATTPIAIVGMACRFPGNVTSPSQLWELCVSGKDGWQPIPESRFDNKSLYHKDYSRAGRSHVEGGYFMGEDISLFDAAFFNLAADVASGLDPQARLMLETVYEATEDGKFLPPLSVFCPTGIPIEKLAGTNTSVYAGTFNKDYHEIQTKDAEVLPHAFLAGTGTAMIANRISHFFDLQGPSMSIDTGCSAGMVVVHQGCQSIRTGESDISVVGAASALLTQDAFISASTIGAIGAEGKCFAWDERAHGYGRGEGVAALILQPLDAALKAGNRVHAIIKDTGLNQDGKTTTITSPSADAQVKLIRECYARAGYDMKDTGYVEAHMTGTAAGDPIEAEAIARTFGKAREPHDPVVVGSVKTNVGHTEPVSGLAAIIKTTFALKNRVIPPNLNFEKANPEIDLQGWHLRVPTAPLPWPQDKLLRASINNFGYGGTNGHLILEPYPSPSALQNGSNGLGNGYNGVHNGVTNGNGIANGSSNGTHNGNGHADTTRSQVFLLSAKDSVACQTMMDVFATHVEKTEPSVEDLAYTLANRRSIHSWVTAVRAQTIEELAKRLRDPLVKPSSTSKRPRLAFVFNGQGAQWHAMGRELIDAYPVFGQSVREADKALREYGASWSLIDELMRDASTTRVADINLSQPVSVAVQLCLVDLLASWGVSPTAVTSHSSGEIAAAYATHVLSFKEALGVAYFRGELALKHQKLHSLAGGMLVAAIGPDDVEKYIGDTPGGTVVVACVNSPSSITLSGDVAALDEVASRLQRDDVFARKLKVPMAYHSHHMLHISPDYIEQLQAILPWPKKTWGEEAATFVSPVTGDKVTSPSTLAPEHWARNMTHPVLFSQAFERMCFDEGGTAPNVDMIVEVGAHSTLAGPMRQILKARDTELPYVSCLKRPENAVETMQDVACALIARGYPVNLNAVNSPLGEEGRVVTDLPSYPWNHTKRFWVEPRLSRDQRYKRFPPHELLGTPINGGNSVTPTWRNFIRLSEIEWLKDHQIDGSVVFPGAGYIALAIEAARLLADPTEATIQGYKLRDIDISNAMVIPESVFGVETHFSLQSCSQRQLDHDGWYEFKLCSLTSGGSWIEHCKGLVTAVTDDRSKVRTAELTRKAEAPREETYFEDASATKVDIEALFSGLRDRGIYHGPEFQNLADSRAAGQRAITNFAIAGIASAVHDYVLHPTTLDSVLQASFSSLPAEMDKDVMVLPRFIRSLVVPKSLKRQGGDRLQAFSELVKADKRGYTSNIAIAAATPEPEEEDSTFANFLQLDGFFGQAVPRRTDDSNQETGICSKSCWELDILHSVPADLRASLAIPLAQHEIDTERKLSRVSWNFISEAMAELQGQDPDTFEWHHKRMYEWMKTVVQDGLDGKLGPGSESWAKASRGLKNMLADELNAQNAAGKLTVRVGRNLAAIIRGEITPLELMMEGNLLNQFYMDHEALKTRSYKHLSTIAELYALKNPGAKVLEIGAGTGGATTTVLEGFGTKGDGSGSILGHYTFTDISPGFFEAARTKFAAWSSLMDFKKLDIEVDPLDQGFTEGAYDLIVAASCLHATKNLNTTMTHVRKLLKPGGTLLLIEATADRLEGQLIFGTLPGWWLGEEPERQMSPNAPLEMWKRVLGEVGFTGVDFDVPDYEEPAFQSARVMLSRAKTNVQSPFSIVVPPKHEASAEETAWLHRASNAIASLTGKPPLIVSLEDVDAWQDTVCIFTAEMETPFVDGIDETAFEQLKKLLNQSAGLVWLSCGGLVDAADPAFGATDGLIRTMRQEDAGKRWIRLDFEKTGSVWSGDKIPHLTHVLEQSFDVTLDATEVEWEYAVKDSLLRVPRTYPDKPFDQPGRPLIWETPKSGATGINPYFVENTELMTTEVPHGMVEVEAKAFGLNFREVMVALGELDEPLKGHESAGIVTALGPGTEASGLKVGDRVCSLVRGRLASKGRTWWTSVAKLPDDLEVSWPHAAAFPAAYVTAYGSLIQIAHLKKGERVLVHAASGATGQAAISLAQHVGAEVYATCSTKAKRDLLVEVFDIQPDHIFSSRDASFAPAIMAATGGKGVDVVLNSLSGPLLKATWDCMARFGRFVDITKIDIEANRVLETAPFGRCAVYTAFDLLQLTEYCGDLTHEALVESIRIIRERSKPPIHPITPFSITDMAKAMRQMQGGAHMGKLVLVPNPGDKVNVITRLPPISIDKADATYLISGGLGGIGRAIAEWFIRKGAKNVVLVSRHASTHAEAPNLIREATAAGCRLLIRDCDVSDEAALLRLLDQVSEAGLPAIRGAITGAMVLDDTVMERMQFSQWSTGVKPKIDGSRNLHKHLPDLAFFVMLSSVAGVAGHMSQANYAAGNTYQDALARHRTARGLPAVTIDLGAVRSVGYVAQREAAGDERLRARVENVGFGSVDLEAVLGIIEAGIRDPLRSNQADCQVIVGPNFHAFATESAMRNDRRFGTLRIASQLGGAAASASGDGGKSSTAAFVKAYTAAGKDVNAAAGLLVQALSAKLSDIFNIPLSDIDPDLPLSRYGVDSLVGVELRNWLSSTVKAKVSVFEILQSASLNEFALLVTGKSELL